MEKNCKNVKLDNEWPIMNLIHTKNFTFFRNDYFYVVVFIVFLFNIFGFYFITVFLISILLYNWKGNCFVICISIFFCYKMKVFLWHLSEIWSLSWFFFGIFDYDLELDFSWETKCTLELSVVALKKVFSLICSSSLTLNL